MCDRKVDLNSLSIEKVVVSLYIMSFENPLRSSQNESNRGDEKPIHKKARLEKPTVYPERFPVPDDKVDWTEDFENYDPQYFVADVVLENDKTKNPNGWADPEELSANTQYESYCGDIRTDEKGRPLNPQGRTGVEGRGLLGKWGPNFAADPIITRNNPETGSPELLAIKRKDTGEYALPGGMVDAGEKMSATAQRELQEEAGISIDMVQATKVYEGYVDDPRNTDNAWMETAAYHYHLVPEDAQKVVLEAGDDASDAVWMSLTPPNVDQLYASHGAMVRRVMEQPGNDEG